MTLKLEPKGLHVSTSLPLAAPPDPETDQGQGWGRVLGGTGRGPGEDDLQAPRVGGAASRSLLDSRTQQRGAHGQVQAQGLKGSHSALRTYWKQDRGRHPARTVFSLCVFSRFSRVQLFATL